ncbi:MAG TPA: peptidylprolyl isomerase [Gemmatimonadaceae bacterium]
MKRSALLAIGAAGLLTACDGLREAMTAHVDVVARAGSQELSVQRLADLVGGAPPQLPADRNFSKALAELWTTYTLLGHAAATGDSLNDPAMIEAAMWAEIANTRLQRFYDSIATRWATVPDSVGGEAAYGRGDLLAAQHILLLVPQDATPQQRDSLRRAAEGIRARATDANFAQLASSLSEDQASARRGGYLGVFPRGLMVPQFEQGVTALRPGQISPVIESQFGFHIIRRPPYSEVREDFVQSSQQRFRQVAESTYIAALESGADVEVKAGAAADLKRIAADIEGSYGDETVLATARGIELTGGRMARWLESLPPQARIRERIQQQPDSTLPNFVRNVMRNELLLRQADSAKVVLDSAELAQMRQVFGQVVQTAWAGLGLSPDSLRAAGATEDDRIAAAAQRVEAYMSALVNNQARFVEVPPPVRAALHEKYEPKVYPAGIDRATQMAQNIRRSADSARSAAQPPSQVPLPQPGAGQPQHGQPQGAAPQGAAPQGRPAPTPSGP